MFRYLLRTVVRLNSLLCKTFTEIRRKREGQGHSDPWMPKITFLVRN